MKSIVRQLALFLCSLVATAALAASGINGAGREVGPGTTGPQMFQDFTRNTGIAPGQLLPGGGGGGGGGGGPTNTACPAGPVNWAVGGNTCNGSIASPVASGSTSPQVTDSTAPTTGSSTFTCNNGTLNQNAGATCATAATNCPAGPVTWTVGGNTCNGSIASPVASGSTSPQVTDSTGPTTGSSTFTCNNGTLNQNAGATCATATSSPGWCVNVVTSTYTFPASSIPLLPAATPIEYLLAGGGSGGSGPGTSCTNCAMVSQRVTGSFTPNAEFYVYVGGGGGGWTTTQPVSGGGGGAGWAGGGGGGYGNPSVLVQTGSSGAGGSTAITYSQAPTATAIAFGPGLQGSFGTGGTPTGGGANAGGNGSLGGTAGTRFDGGNAGRTGNTNVTYFPQGGRGPNGSNGGGSSGANGAASGQGGGGFGGGGAGSGIAGGLGAMTMAPMVSANAAAITVPADVGRANGSGGANGGHGGNAGIAVLRYPTSTGQCVPGFTNVPSTVPPTQASCSGAVSWTVGGDTCSGTLPSTVASGATSTTVSDNTAPTTGMSTFTCNNGTATQNAGATCSGGQVGASCPATTLSWVARGLQCSGAALSTPSGQVAFVDSSNANTGNANFLCTNGSFSPNPFDGAHCQLSPACTGQTITWSVLSGLRVNTCQAYFPASSNSGPAGSIQGFLTRQNADGTFSAGTALVDCTNGRLTPRQGTTSCGDPPAAVCSPTTFNWSRTAGNGTTYSCSTFVNVNAISGGSATVFDTTSPNFGKAVFYCQFGNWVADSNTFNCSASN